MQAITIPVYTTVGGRLLGGTAFLGETGGTIHLVTAAHCFTGIPAISANWVEWESELTAFIVTANGAVDQLQLRAFEESPTEGRSPRFKYVNHPFTEGRILDLVLFPIADDWEWVNHYAVIDLDKGAPPTPGDSVTIIGYPVGIPTWPELSSVNGPIVEYPAFPAISNVRIEGSVSVGYSGGPGFADQTGFIGMMIGDSADELEQPMLIPPGYLRRAAFAPGGSIINPPAAQF